MLLFLFLLLLYSLFSVQYKEPFVKRIYKIYKCCIISVFCIVFELWVFPGVVFNSSCYGKRPTTFNLNKYTKKTLNSSTLGMNENVYPMSDRSGIKFTRSQNPEIHKLLHYFYSSLPRTVHRFLTKGHTPTLN